MFAVFVISAFVLITKLLAPTTIQIITGGEEPIVVGQFSSYTPVDVVVIVISALIFGISGFYLLLPSFIAARGAGVPPTQTPEIKPELDAKFALHLLNGDEKRVFSEIMESGEILQKDLTIQMNFPKVKISRILDSLEKKSLVIRKRYGMTNKIIVNKNMRAEA